MIDITKTYVEIYTNIIVNNNTVFYSGIQVKCAATRNEVIYHVSIDIVSNSSSERRNTLSLGLRIAERNENNKKMIRPCEKHTSTLPPNDSLRTNQWTRSWSPTSYAALFPRHACQNLRMARYYTLSNRAPANTASRIKRRLTVPEERWKLYDERREIGLYRIRANMPELRIIDPQICPISNRLT